MRDAALPFPSQKLRRGKGKGTSVTGKAKGKCKTCGTDVGKGKGRERDLRDAVMERKRPFWPFPKCETQLCPFPFPHKSCVTGKGKGPPSQERERERAIPASRMWERERDLRDAANGGTGQPALK